MRILFFTHYYPPEVNAPASRTSEHCRAWVEAGAEVTVVTCAPNHPDGKVYPGFHNRLWQVETLDEGAGDQLVLSPANSATLLDAVRGHLPGVLSAPD